MNKPKNTLLILVIIVLVAVLGYRLYIKSGNKVPTQVTQNSVTSSPAAQNTSDLDSMNTQLDNTNLNQIDTSLNQLSTESSGF